MSEHCQDTLSIHVKKITDACRDKDCIEDLRVYLTQCSQDLLERAANVRVRCADLLDAHIEVEPVAFDRRHYFVDVTFFYRIMADATVGAGRPVALTGLAYFTKRAVLCGEDSKAHIFRSDTRMGAIDGATARFANRPTAVVEVLDPMVLASKVREVCEHRDVCAVQIPNNIGGLFEDPLVLGTAQRQLFVTLGQFSIIRLERDAQIIVPFMDYAIPTKECCDATGNDEDPCEMFSHIPFPTQQFTSNECDQPDCGCH